VASKLQLQPIEVWGPNSFFRCCLSYLFI